jgi:hypothetical protein
MRSGVKAFLKAIAVNGAGQAVTLAALGIKTKAMVMPNMSIEPRCTLTLPKGAWVNDLNWLHSDKIRQARYLEVTCWQISGAVAEFAFDESDHYGNLGLGDIEGFVSLSLRPMRRLTRSRRPGFLPDAPSLLSVSSHSTMTRWTKWRHICSSRAASTSKK